MRWLRDNLSIISAAPEVEQLASKVDSSHGVFFVPAFSGLLAPHWRPDARGTIVGLTCAGSGTGVGGGRGERKKERKKERKNE